MELIYSPEHALHDPPYEILDGRAVDYFEKPERAEIIRAALQAAGIGPFIAPRSFGLEPLRAVHSDDYLAYLEHAYERWIAAGGAPSAVMPAALPLRALHRASPHPRAEAGYYCFDLSAPIVGGTYAAARASADVALTGAALLREGRRAAYALCRPPGHHAGRDMCGGYCYLNNAAIAAHSLCAATHDDGHSSTPQDAALQRSSFVFASPVVALLDIDFHHGNGTQEIFYERSDVLFISIHADPAREYPYFLGNADERGTGTGTGYNLNLPLEAGTDDARFLAALDTALDEIRAYRPQYLVVSAGFDTFIDDPLGDFALSSAVFHSIGVRLASLALPTLIVQEGGYAIAALGDNVVRLLQGFEGRPASG